MKFSLEQNQLTALYWCNSVCLRALQCDYRMPELRVLRVRLTKQQRCWSAIGPPCHIFFLVMFRGSQNYDCTWHLFLFILISIMIEGIYRCIFRSGLIFLAWMNALIQLFSSISTLKALVDFIQDHVPVLGSAPMYLWLNNPCIRKVVVLLVACFIAIIVLNSPRIIGSIPWIYLGVLDLFCSI